MIFAQAILLSTLILAVSSGQTRLETAVCPNCQTRSTASAQCEIVGLCHVSSEFVPFTFP